MAQISMACVTHRGIDNVGNDLRPIMCVGGLPPRVVWSKICKHDSLDRVGNQRFDFKLCSCAASPDKGFKPTFEQYLKLQDRIGLTPKKT
jgi:hypothetical protein